SFLFTPQSTRAALERIGFRVLAWHDTTQEALEQQIARAKALESGSLPPLGLHILIGEAYPAVTKNMLQSAGAQDRTSQRGAAAGLAPDMAMALTRWATSDLRSIHRPRDAHLLGSAGLSIAPPPSAQSLNAPRL